MIVKIKTDYRLMFIFKIDNQQIVIEYNGIQHYKANNFLDAEIEFILR